MLRLSIQMRATAALSSKHAAAAAASVLPLAHLAAASAHVATATTTQHRDLHTARPTLRAANAAFRPSRSASSASSSPPTPTSVTGAPSSSASFASLSLSAPLQAALASISITSPTAIQRHSLPTLLTGRDALLASHTGSGKTLAYLLPVIQQLKRDEQELRVSTRLGRPRALVVVPNRELAVQVLSICKSLSHQGKFRSFASTGFIPLSKLARALEDPIDLLVVTPGRLEFLLGSGRIQLSDVKYVVLDETDTLLSPEHGFVQLIERSLLQPLQARIKAKQLAAKAAAAITPAAAVDPFTLATPAPTASHANVQFIFCSASITPSIEEHLSKHFPSLVRLHTPSLHHVPQSLVTNNILVGNKDKALMLWDLLLKESDNYKRRLMHHRTREQNKRELAALGGDERKLWEHLAAVDCGSRGIPFIPEIIAGTLPTDVHASVTGVAGAEHKLIQAQLEFNEAEQGGNNTTAAASTSKQSQEEDDESDPDHPSHSAPEDIVEGGDSAPSTAPAPVFLPLPPTMIFCNTVSCCRAMAWFLTERGLNVGHYHGLMPAQYRTAHFKNFLSGATNILVCTDLASRGLDTTFVQHVIHFDFPFHVLDFIHRVGRTARAGRKGKSTALVAKKDRILANAIERLSTQGLSIEQLSADRDRYGPDGLPLSVAVFASKLERMAAPPAPEGVTADGVKVLPSSRRAPKKPSLRPGEQPRRRWMRYMAPRARNAHKLLYAKQQEFAPSQQQRPSMSAKKLRRDEDQGMGMKDVAPVGAAAKAAAGANNGKSTHPPPPSSSAEQSRDPASDPFAFSSPYGRHRNATNPAEAAAALRTSQQAASVAAGRPPTRFPAAPGGLKRTQAIRPLGPLAHKQKVGAIFVQPPPTAAKVRPPPTVHHHASPTSGAAKRTAKREQARAEGVRRTSHQAGKKHFSNRKY